MDVLTACFQLADMYPLLSPRGLTEVGLNSEIHLCAASVSTRETVCYDNEQGKVF